MFNEKLSRRENEVMRAVYTLSGGRERFLVAPYDMLAVLPSRAGYDEEKLERVLRALELDGYFQLISSERKGERTYVVWLHEKGLSYPRANAQRRRGLYFKLGLTVATAVLSFLIGLLLKALFT